MQMTVPFDVDVRPMAGGTTGWVITLSGEVDSSTSPRLMDTVLDLIASAAPFGTHEGTAFRGPLVVMDLSRVEFVDSSGLRVIVSVANELERLGGRLELDGLSAAARRILELTGLIDRYRSDPSAATDAP
jgi:anti-sigma B factor antagonist